jgi:hypothetical protein
MSDDDVPAHPNGCIPKQFGDACEMLVAAYLTLAGVPTTVMPDGWPDYDLIAQPPDRQQPERISVKARYKSLGTTSYRVDLEGWDWLALVFLAERGAKPQFWIIPRDVALAKMRQPRSSANGRTTFPSGAQPNHEVSLTSHSSITGTPPRHAL